MKLSYFIFAVSLSIALFGCATRPPANENGAPVASPNIADTPPKVIQAVNPVYPLAAQSKGIVGVVTVVFDVGANGKVVFATITESPDPTLSEAVVSAISQWKFIPGTHNGKKVNVRMKMPFTFGQAKQ